MIIKACDPLKETTITDIKAIRKARRDLEEDFCNALVAFTESTGIAITGLYLNYDNNVLSRPIRYWIEIEIKL